MQKCHSIIVTGKVQDIGFRSVVEHIGRSFGIPGLVFNAKDGSVKIGAEIEGIKEQLLPFIDLPDEFSKASSDDEIDIGRKLDKANLLLKCGFDNLNTDLNSGFNKLTDILGSYIGEQREHNRGQQEHNIRLEAILEKLAER